MLTHKINLHSCIGSIRGMLQNLSSNNPCPLDSSVLSEHPYKQLDDNTKNSQLKTKFYKTKCYVTKLNILEGRVFLLPWWNLGSLMMPWGIRLIPPLSSVLASSQTGSLFLVGWWPLAAPDLSFTTFAHPAPSESWVSAKTPGFLFLGLSRVTYPSLNQSCQRGWE